MFYPTDVFNLEISNEVLLSNTIFSLPSKQDIHNYIPWDETDIINRARMNLNFIVEYFNSISNGEQVTDTKLTPSVASILHKFILANCSDLLIPFTGDTGIPLSVASPEYWNSGQSQIKDLSSSFSKGYVKGLEHKSGIYCFWGNDKLACGSNLDFTDRLAFHYHIIRGELLPNRPLYAEILRLGIENFKYSPIVTFDNIYHLFTQQYPELSDVQGCKGILDLFGQFKARCLEQAVKSAVELELNGKGPITFTTHWDPIKFDNLAQGSRPFYAIDDSNLDIVRYSSIKQGAEELGISRKTVQTVMNYFEHYTKCPGRGNGLYTLLEQDQPSYTGSPHESLNPRNRPLLPYINYDLLPTNSVIGIDKEYTVRFIWKTTGLAAAACGLGSYINVSRWVNNRWVSVIIDNQKHVIAFVRNPLGLKGNKKSILVLDTLNNSSFTFNSLADCLRHFKEDVSVSSQWMKQYIRNKSLYKDRYKVQYVNTNVSHLNIGDKARL